MNLMKGPVKFLYEPNSMSLITMIAGGVGITPMLQVLRTIFTNPEDETRVVLMWGNYSEKDQFFRKELDDIRERFPSRFKCFYALNNPPDKYPARLTGMIDKTMLSACMPRAG
eukprot:257540_1